MIGVETAFDFVAFFRGEEAGAMMCQKVVRNSLERRTYVDG